MTSVIPPLAAVRVFEAASRHGSFTKAADELGMTQAAVSYQIKVLEDRVGGALFLRRPRQVELTALGETLAPAIIQAFELMRASFSSLREDKQGTLVISSLQTFSAQWLVRHLGRFQVAHPGVAVRVMSSDHMVDFAREDVDIGIRSGTGRWPGLKSHLLIATTFTPMLSPQLAETNGGVHEPADLLKLPFIDASDPWWADWFEAAGVDHHDLDTRPRSRLGAQTLEASAAMAGQGVAILTPNFYQMELETGRLWQPFELTCSAPDCGYFLVYPEARRNTPKVRVFREWLLEEVVATGLVDRILDLDERAVSEAS